MRRLTDFLASIKRYLAKAQDDILFDPYKFTGDGWILLFPVPVTNGVILSDFLKKLCEFFAAAIDREILPYLANPPSTIGLTFGIEKGPLKPMTVYGQPEYIGRALNIACRLQNAVKDKGGSPAFNALVTNSVFAEYFASVSFPQVLNVTRTLRNINHGEIFRCRKIELFRVSGAP